MERQAGSGRLEGIHTSPGGVPKRPVEEATVGPLGIEGDLQRDRRHHGGPQRALCLYSAERLESLRSDGHPVAPGGLGENLLLSGLPWERVVPGSRVVFEGGVSLEVTSFAVPCATIAGSFKAGEILRVSQEHHPGWSRLYARVLRGGRLRPGETCRWSPAPSQPA